MQVFENTDFYFQVVRLPVMAGTTFCDVPELYNILNQYTRLSRLPEFNYLCLIGKRPVGSDCHIGSTRFKQIHCVDKHNLFLRFNLTIR